MAGHPKKGLRTKARLIFLDESGFSERPSVRRTWAPKGETPIIRSTGSWQVRSVTGAIGCTPRGQKPRLFFKFSRRTITAPEVIRFLHQLRRHTRGKVILLWDGLPGHRAKLVQRFVIANRSWLTTERFPAYAPELNPVEYLWAAVKTKDTANCSPTTLADMDRRIRHGVRRLRRQPNVLTGCLRASGLFTKLS